MLKRVQSVQGLRLRRRAGLWRGCGADWEDLPSSLVTTVVVVVVVVSGRGGSNGRGGRV